MLAMSKRIPQLSPTASPQARNIHAFLVRRGLTMLSWTKAAGLSNNILSELFAGNSQGMTYERLKRLADAASVTVEELTNAPPAPPLPDDALVSIADVRAALSAWSAAAHFVDGDAVAKAILSGLAAMVAARTD